MHLFAGHLTILEPKFDAQRTWEIIEREKVQLIFMTGDAMARPLIEEFERKAHRHAVRRPQPVRDLQQRGDLQPAGEGALDGRRSRTRLHRLGRRLRDRLPGHGPAGQGRTSAPRARSSGSAPTASSSTTTTTSSTSTKDVGDVGRLGRGGSVPLGYYKDPEKSARTFLEIDGERYSVPGDFARIEADGKVTLLGRGSNCINTGGEKVFPEEVEMAIKGHPDVYDVLVVGVPDERYGQSVTAVIQPREDADVELEDLRTFLRQHALRLQAAARDDPGRARSRATPPARRSTPRPRSWRWPRSPPRSPPHRQGPEPMRTELCDRFGIEYPIFAFTPSEHVAAAVSRAGGLGVLGCVRFNDAEELDADADLARRQHRRQAVRRRRRDADEDPHRGQVGRPQGDDPRGAHHASSSGRCSSSAYPRCRRARAAKASSAGCTRSPASHVDVALKHRPGADRQRARLAAGRRDRAGARGGRPGGRAGRRGQARAVARGERRRHHRGAGLRGRRAHRRDRQHGADPGDRGRRRSRRPGARRRRHRLRPPGRGLARARRAGRVDRVGLADHRGVPEPQHQQGHDRGLPARRAAPTRCAPASTPASPRGC